MSVVYTHVELVAKSPPLCPHCGEFWNDRSEMCVINHAKDLEFYADSIRAITKRELANSKKATAPLEVDEDRHVRGYD